MLTEERIEELRRDAEMWSHELHELCDLALAVLKLPVTRDGVRVVPGMKLWRPPYDEDGETFGPFQCQPISDRMVWMGPPGSKHGSGPHDLTELYSTAESAARGGE